MNLLGAWLLAARDKLLALPFAIPFVCAACTSAESADPRTAAPVVRVAVVERSVSGMRSFTGTVVARVQSDLGFRVAGKVQARLVEIGQDVRRGEPLMRIDPVDLKLAVLAQQELAAAAHARAQQAAKDEARLRDLLGTGAVSMSAYDQAKAAADAAQAQVIAAEAQADAARNASAYTELLADDDGVVVETLAEPGQVVSAGQVVVRLAHAGPREAEVHLPETLRPKLGSAGQAVLYGDGGPGVATRLRQLSAAADPVTRTFEARYVLEGAQAAAPLGATVTVQISGSRPSSGEMFQVPISALFDAGGGPGLWLITGDPAQVSWKAVVVEGLDGQSARISGELQPGNRVVALGAHLLREGDRVRPAGPALPASAARATDGRS